MDGGGERVAALSSYEVDAVIEVLMLEEQRKARDAFEALIALEEKLSILVGRPVEASIVLDAATGAHLQRRLQIEGFLREHQGAPERLAGHAGLRIGAVSVYWPEA